MSRNARAVTLIAGLLILWVLAQWLGREIVEPEWAASFPDDLWAGEAVSELSLSENEARVLGVDHYRFFEWYGAGPRVWIYLGYYAGQRSDSQVHAPEHCYPGTGWEIVRQTKREEGVSARRELRIEYMGNSRLVWYGYRTRLGAPISAWGLKRDQVLATLLGRSRDALLVRLSTPVLEVDGEEGARERLDAAWKLHAARVAQWFDEEGG